MTYTLHHLEIGGHRESSRQYSCELASVWKISEDRDFLQHIQARQDGLIYMNKEEFQK
jgi:hypothetical protein